MSKKGIGWGSLIVIGIVALCFSGSPQAPHIPIGPDAPTVSETAAPLSKAPAANVSRAEPSMIQRSNGTTDASSSNTAIELPPKPKVDDRLIIVDGKQYPNLPYKISASTNDPYVDQPWEQLTYVPQARQIGSGSYAPKVAVIDSGINVNHEDLRSNTWLTNAAESGLTTSEAPSRLNCTDRQLPITMACNNIDDNLDGIVDNETGSVSIENESQHNCSALGLPLDKSCNNIDDDGNGLIDDYKGFDFASYDRSVLPGQTNAVGEGVAHGTLVAGVIAATNNNGLGLAGVSANAQILPLQALSDDGDGYTSTVSEAIYYAISREVDVISMSLGGEIRDLYLKQAIDAANRAGIVIVAAAGNDNCECAQYPAAFEAVISVGATDNTNQRASFSNWGSTVDIVAPGVNLYTTSWSSSNQTTRYNYASGTSLSTPVVSGLVALLLSQNQSAAPLQIKAMLHEKAQRLTMSSGEFTSSTYGHGLVHAQHSLQRAVTPLTAEQIYSFAEIRSGNKGYSNLWTQTETGKAVLFYSCEAGSSPSVAVTRLTKTDSMLYSASEIEIAAAVANGYTATKAFYWCTLMDHDVPTIVRSMNIYAELHNTYRKDW